MGSMQSKASEQKAAREAGKTVPPERIANLRIQERALSKIKKAGRQKERNLKRASEQDH